MYFVINTSYKIDMKFKLIPIVLILIVTILYMGCVNNKNSIKEVESKNCYVNELGDNGVNESPVNDSLSIEEISKLFDLTSDEVIKKLRGKYKIVPAGAEGSFEGYSFEDKGIVVIFESDKINWINCYNSVDINGACAGMNFEQIQEKLGKTKILETWFEVPENKAYELIYEIYNCDVSFLSYDRSGQNTSVWIYKKGRLDSKKD